VGVIYRAAKCCSQFSTRIDGTAWTRNDRYRYTRNSRREENSGV